MYCPKCGILSFFAFIRDTGKLDINSNQFGGPFHDGLFQLPRIRQIFANDNSELVGTIPENSSGSIEQVRLGGTKMSGQLPESLFDLIRCAELNLERAMFSGNLSESFAKLRNMAILQLNNNTFTGTIPAAFDEMTHLNVLFLHGNNLAGNISTSLCGRRGINFSQLNNLTADCAGATPVGCNCCTLCYAPP